MKKIRSILIVFGLLVFSLTFGQKNSSEDTVFIIAKRSSVHNRDVVTSKVFEKGQKIIYSEIGSKKYRKGKITAISDSGMTINKQYIAYSDLKKIKIDNNFRKAMKITGFALTGVGAAGGVIMTIITENPVYAIVGVGVAGGGLAMGLSFYRNYSVNSFKYKAIHKKDIPQFLEQVKKDFSSDKKYERFLAASVVPETNQITATDTTSRIKKADSVINKPKVSEKKDFTANYLDNKSAEDKIISAPIPLKEKIINNRIKVWYPNLYATDISLSYERRLDKHHAFEVGLGYIYNFDSPFKRIFENYAMFNDGTNHSLSYNEGIVVRGSYIYYFTENNFYVSPMLLYKYTEMGADNVKIGGGFFNRFGSHTNRQSESAQVVGLSALIGKQWTVGNLFSIDAFIGPGIKYKHADVIIFNENNYYIWEGPYLIYNTFNKFYPDLQFGFKLGFCFFDVEKKK